MAQVKAKTPAAVIVGVFTIVVMTFAAYWPALHAGFIWDDDSYVTANKLLHDLDGLRLIWIPRQTPQYYPAVFTTFWLEYQLWGLRPTGYHVVNVLLHICNALLIWRVATRLRLPRIRTVAGAWFIAAVFALHPVHVESVAWITERKNVLSGLFYLAAALCFLRFDDAHVAGSLPQARRLAWAWYAGCLVLFVLALLSKTVTCSLPFALVLMLLHLRRGIDGRRLLALAPMFAIGLVLALNTAAIEREHVGAVGAEFQFTLAERIIIASRSLWFYPWKLLWPYPLMFVYPRWTIDASQLESYVATAGIIAIGLVATWAWIRGRRGPLLALLFYAGTIFPALGFVNVYPMRFSFVADHFQYLASLGIIVLTVCAIWPSRARPAWTVGIGGVILGLLGSLAFEQSASYVNAETVWRDTISKNPNAWMPHNNLGNILIHRDPVEAELHYRRALELKPDHHPARSNLAESLRLQNRLQESIAETNAALEQVRRTLGLGADSWPRFTGPDWRRLGMAHESLAHDEDAIEAYRQAFSINPDDSESQRRLIDLLLKANRIEEASIELLSLVQADPTDWSSHRALALIAVRRTNWQAAAHHFDAALRNAPAFEQQLQVMPPYVRMLATCPEPEFRNTRLAVTLAERIATALGRSDPAVLDMLSLVYAADGRINQAIDAAERAIEHAGEDMPGFMESMRQRLSELRDAQATQPDSTDTSN